MLRYSLILTILALIPAVGPHRPPPIYSPGGDPILPNPKLTVTPVDAHDSTSLRLTFSPGYIDWSVSPGGVPALLTNLQIRADIRSTVPGYDEDINGWFTTTAQPVTYQILNGPVINQLMNVVVTGLQPGTTYCFGVRETTPWFDTELDYGQPDQVPPVPSMNVAVGTTATDATVPDTINPAAVVVTGSTTSTVSFTIVTPGDDQPYVGQATGLEFRYSQTAPGADLEAWYTQIPASNHRSFDPGLPNQSQPVTLTNLQAGTHYFIAGRATDEVGGEGILTGVFSATTGTPPPDTGSEKSGCGAGSAFGAAALLAVLSVPAALLLRRS